MHVRATRGAQYTVNGASPIDIVGLYSVQYTLHRQLSANPVFNRWYGLSKTVNGEILVSDMELATTLFDLIPFGLGTGPVPDIDLIVRYNDIATKMKKTFKCIMTGVSPGDSLGTLQDIDTAQVVLHRITFMLRMPPSGKVSENIITEIDTDGD